MLVLVLSVLLVACGGTSSSPPASPANTSTPESPAESVSVPAEASSVPAPVKKTREEEIAELVSMYNIPVGENEYIGIGPGGFHGKVYLKVTMDGDTITAVEVVHHEETEGQGTLAINALPEEFVKAQSSEVDIVAGATLTSNAMMAAVQDVLDHLN